jgi:hypothetical protein
MRIAIAIIIAGLCIGGCATPVHEAARWEKVVPVAPDTTPVMVPARA